MCVCVCVCVCVSTTKVPADKSIIVNRESYNRQNV